MESCLCWCWLSFFTYWQVKERIVGVGYLMGMGKSYRQRERGCYYLCLSFSIFGNLNKSYTFLLMDIPILSVYKRSFILNENIKATWWYGGASLNFSKCWFPPFLWIVTCSNPLPISSPKLTPKYILKAKLNGRSKRLW